MRPLLASLLLVTACAHEQRLAAKQLGCAESQVADVTRQPPETPVASDDVGGKVLLLVVGNVLAAMAGLRTHGGSIGGAPEPTPVWPHVWTGCGKVALCEESGECRAAYWLEPKNLPALMERSKHQDFLEHYGIGACPEVQTEVRATSAVTWDLFVCRQVIKCWSVTADQQFQCGWSVIPPKEAAP